MRGVSQLVVVVQCARVKHKISITSAGTEVDLVMIRGLKSVTLCLAQLCKHACGMQRGYFNNTMEQCLVCVCAKSHLHLPEAALTLYTYKDLCPIERPQDTGRHKEFKVDCFFYGGVTVQ